jgi:hypothetical protein
MIDHSDLFPRGDRRLADAMKPMRSIPRRQPIDARRGPGRSEAGGELRVYACVGTDPSMNAERRRLFSGVADTHSPACTGND